MLDELDAAAVRRFARSVADALDEHRAEIDRINVFPVPDGDTGTNLATTMRAATAALDAAESLPSAGAALGILARAAVGAASGNSGAILAELLIGLARPAEAAHALDAPTLAAGLRCGADLARVAVARPVEGTVITVADAAADGAAAAGSRASLAEVVSAALAGAVAALAATPDQLPVLARAGVVDAGGRGLELVLRALAGVVGIDGAPPDRFEVATVEQRPLAAAAPGGAGPLLFEVQYLLDTAPDFGEEGAARLRERLGQVADSVVVVGSGESMWSVHAHTTDVGPALEAGLDAGRPYRISVTPIVEPDHPRKPSALVVLAEGDGLARLVAQAAAGVNPVAPRVADVVAAVRGSGADEVVLLPTDARGTEIAEQVVDRSSGVRVAVVPTRSPVQALAAIAVHDAGRRFDDDVVAMAEAAAATRYAEVVVARDRSLTAAGICQAGDVLGLIDGEVVHIGHGLLSVAFTVTDRLLGVGAELMTVLVDAAERPGVAATIRRHALDRSAYTEVVVYDVPGSPLVIGVE